MEDAKEMILADALSTAIEVEKKNIRLEYMVFSLICTNIITGLLLIINIVL